MCQQSHEIESRSNIILSESEYPKICRICTLHVHTYTFHNVLWSVMWFALLLMFLSNILIIDHGQIKTPFHINVILQHSERKEFHFFQLCIGVRLLARLPSASATSTGRLEPSSHTGVFRSLLSKYTTDSITY